MLTIIYYISLLGWVICKRIIAPPLNNIVMWFIPWMWSKETWKKDLIHLWSCLHSNYVTHIWKGDFPKVSSWHIFIHKQPLIIFDAISNEFDDICMVKLTKEVDFCLQNHKKNNLSDSLNLNPSSHYRTHLK